MSQKVSIIIPVYNVEKYLSQCIDSVLEQTFTDLDILVIDDGSTDRSGSICDEYAAKESRIRVFHTENRGLSAARNYGLDRCNGDYFAFLDSDDWLENRAIELLVESILSEDADIAVCGHYVEWEDYSEVEIVPDAPRISTGNAIVNEYLHGLGIGVQVWNKLYRSSVFNRIRFPEHRLYEDIATTYKFLETANRLVRVPELLVHYRMRKSSIGKTHSLKNLTDCWISCYERYKALIDVYGDCRVELVSSCMYAIGRFWIWYYGCNKETLEGSIISEMQAFAREHEHEIMTEKGYTNAVKVSCRIAKHANSFAYKVPYYINQVRCKLKSHANRMYV